VGLAAQAIAIGVCANALLKLGVAAVLGGPRYRVRAVSGLAVLFATGVATIVVLAR
jgi:hypothetical protein